MEKLVYIIKTPPFWTKTPPLSLAYLKTYLEKQQIPVTIIDMNIALFKLLAPALSEWLKLNSDFETNLFSRIEKEHPKFLRHFYEEITSAKIIGFSIFKRNYNFAKALAERIKQKFPDKKIIFGGPHTLFLDKENKINDDNYWVIGEGEIPFSKIILNGKNKIYRFNEIENLDELAFCDFSPLDIRKYSNALSLLSSRGCPYQCRFCSERLLYKNFRHHSAEYMIGQIKYLQNKYKINNFVFCDSLINYKQSWLQKLCSLIIEEKLNIKWEAQMRIDGNFPLELAKLMKESGCYNLFIGLESGSDKVLNFMNKGFSADQASKLFKILNAAGLHFEVSLIFGYPGETDKDFTQTLNFFKANKTISKVAQANPFVDYLNNFPKDDFSSDQGKRRVKSFLKFLEVKKIKYTKSFINNLIYPQSNRQNLHSC